MNVKVTITIECADCGEQIDTDFSHSIEGAMMLLGRAERNLNKWHKCQECEVSDES